MGFQQRSERLNGVLLLDALGEMYNVVWKTCGVVWMECVVWKECVVWCGWKVWCGRNLWCGVEWKECVVVCGVEGMCGVV